MALLLTDARTLGSVALSGPVTARVAQDVPGSANYRVTLTVHPAAGSGDVTGKAVFPPCGGRVSPLTLTVFALSTDSMSAAPDIVAFGTLARDQIGPKRSVALYARQPFRLTRIETDDPRVNVEFTRVFGANAYNLCVSYAGGWEPGTHSGVITVHSDLGGGASRDLHYRAEVL